LQGAEQAGREFLHPPRNAIFGLNFPLGASARGVSRIKDLSFYLDAVLLSSEANNPGVEILISVPKQGVSHVARVVATDSGGHQFTASKKVEAQYTYGQYDCYPVCVPGITIVAPQSEDYVTDTFLLKMEIQDNPNPITSMTAYLDNNKIATSNGPTLQREISGAPQGTHILTVTGVDTQGLVYRIQENINIAISK